ncbi:unnamed protein product [Schistosoma bovis]|nr:unnamed protein product [Schistosoma bovis]
MNVHKTIEYKIIQQFIKIADEIDNEFNDNQLKRKCERISQSNYGSFQCSIIHNKKVYLCLIDLNKYNRFWGLFRELLMKLHYL